MEKKVQIKVKSCLELNFLQKGKWAYMYIFPQSGAKGLWRLIWLKYYNVQKRQITFILGPNTVKNMNYLEKTSSKSFLKKFVNFPKFISKFAEIHS